MKKRLTESKKYNKILKLSEKKLRKFVKNGLETHNLQITIQQSLSIGKNKKVRVKLLKLFKSFLRIN